MLVKIKWKIFTRATHVHTRIYKENSIYVLNKKKKRRNIQSSNYSRILSQMGVFLSQAGVEDKINNAVNKALS